MLAALGHHEEEETTYEAHHDRAGGRGDRSVGLQRRRVGASEGAVRAGEFVLGRPVRGGRLGDRRRDDRLLQAAQQPRRRHQRRQDHLGEVRDRVQQRPRRRVLRAHQEEGPDRRDPDPPALDRHHLLADRQGDGRQDPDRLDRLRPHRCLRRARLPVRLPADHQLLVAEHRQDQVHRPEGRRDGQAEGQEDREPLSRLGLRQGDDPGSRHPGEEVRLRGDAHRGAAPGQRAAGAVAAGPPGPAGLGDPAGLGGDEPDGAEGGGEGGFPAREGRSACGGRARRRT